MTCKPVIGKGFTAIVCSRGKAKPALCSIPGCTRLHTKLCDHPVTRDGVAGTCDVRLCNGHATVFAAGVDYCPPHADHARRKAAMR